MLRRFHPQRVYKQEPFFLGQRTYKHTHLNIPLFACCRFVSIFNSFPTWNYIFLRSQQELRFSVKRFVAITHVFTQSVCSRICWLMAYV